MTYTVTDIFTRVQRSFGDESAVQVTEADVIRWINDAQREAVMQHEGLLFKESFLSAVAGTQEYALPSDLFTLTHVSYRDGDTGRFFPLRYIAKSALNEYVPGWDGDTSTGYPRFYTRDELNKIIFYPNPSTSWTNNIKLEYSRYPVDLVDANDAIDLPPYYHSYVEHFCMMKAYEMDEDWESVDKKAALVQSTLDFNNSREAWFGRETYPSVNPIAEDF